MLKNLENKKACTQMHNLLYGFKVYKRDLLGPQYLKHSYGLCNANPHQHGVQEEEHQIGLKYNLNPLEKIEKEFNKINL